MNNILSKIFLTVFTGITSIFGLHLTGPMVSPPSFGDYNVSGGGTYRIQSSISTTQNTITLSSFKEPISNIKYTMSYLNSSIEYGTLDPQNNSSKEFISFTGITQNADGTALLTGVTRGLSFSYPFTASTTLAQPHSGQSIFILSNPPQLYNQFYNLSNVSTSTNTLIFASTTPPRYDLVPLNQALGTYVSTTSELASIAYVNATGAGVNVNATESVKGIIELSTQTEMSASTPTGSTGAAVVLQSKYATSSPYLGSGSYVPITQNSDNKISPFFIATSSTYRYDFGAAMNFASTSMTATTSIAASSLTNGAFTIRAIPYVWPTSQSASSSGLQTNGAGVLSWIAPKGQYTYASTSSATIGANVIYTSSVVAIPAATLTASSSVIMRGTYQCVSGGSTTNNCVLDIVDNNGNVYATYSVTGILSRTFNFTFDAVILSNNATNAQKAILQGSYVNTNDGTSVYFNNSGTQAIDWTAVRTFGVKLTTTSGTGNTGTLNSFSIIVNP